jgi:hypothetical protein
MANSAFEVADVLVALGGDIGNTVPKRVTAAEIALLQMIHGNDAITEVKLIGTVSRAQRAERSRLQAIYGGAKNNQGEPLIEKLYPGAAARVFEALDELSLVDAQFAAVRVGRGGSARQRAMIADAEAGARLAADDGEMTPTPEPEEGDEDEGDLPELPADDEPAEQSPVGALG